MNAITSLKTINNESNDKKIQVEYEVLSPIDISTLSDPTRREIALALQDVEKQINLCEEEIAKLNIEIEKLTSHADGLDYAIAVTSGVLTGLIDSFFVGELGLFDNASDEAKEKFRPKDKSNKIVNKFIEKYAKTRAGMKGESSKVSDLKSAIKYLQDAFPVAQDNTWSGEGISSTHTHHLDDLAHHPTLMGLVSAILVQFFRISLFASKDGKLHPRIVETSMKDLSCWIPVVISGVFKWLSYMAEKNDLLDIDEELPESIKLLIKNIHKSPIILQLAKVADNWFGHLASDMGGSKNTAGGGMGVPGIFISLLKEISMLPGFKDTKLPQLVNDLYASKKYTTDKIDLRTEIAVVKQQAMPVLINEVIVRGFYFVRSLCQEAKEHNVTTFNDLSKINWENVIPFGNRTVERMMTIASGTFTAVDIADAAIRGAINSGGTWAGFAKEFILRVNFVGIGRFAVAVGVDIGMGIKRNKLRNERIATYNQMLMLSGAKVYYLEAGMWCSAIDTKKTLEKTMEIAENSVAYFAESWQNIEEDMQIIGGELTKIVDADSEFAQEILDELDY